MPEVNGLEFSRIIGERCRIIFTTAFEQYAVDSYRVNALDYLLKPFSYSDFLQACEKARRWFELKNQSPAAQPSMPQSIFVKSEYKLIQIDLDKILYIEGLKDYVKIYVEDEAHPVLSLMSLKSLEEQLPEQKFVRVHRSFIVQMDKIKVIERNRIVFGKTYIPISDSYKDQLVEQLNRRSHHRQTVSLSPTDAETKKRHDSFTRCRAALFYIKTQSEYRYNLFQRRDLISGTGNRHRSPRIAFLTARCPLLFATARQGAIIGIEIYLSLLSGRLRRYRPRNYRLS